MGTKTKTTKNTKANKTSRSIKESKRMSKNPTTQTNTLVPPLDTLDVPASIIVLWSDNARTNADPKYLKELAASIKRDGQLQAIGLERMTGKDEGKFLLIFGFSRFTAICGKKEEGYLGQDTIRARIFDPMDDKERALLNLVENMQRENLSTYDVAIAANRLREMFEMSGASIATKLGKSSSYINNLIKAAVNCSPTILAAWREENMPEYNGKRCITPDWLNKVAKGELGKPAFTHEEQDAELLRLQGKTPEKPAGGEGGEEGTGKTGITPTEKLAGKRALKQALAAAEEKHKAAATEKKAKFLGVVNALKFALGMSDIIPGVFVGKEDASDDTEE